MEILEKKIEALGIKKTYAKDTCPFYAQEEALGFFYILRGEVRVFQMDDSGKELEIVRLRPGEFFGEAIAFARERFPAYARVIKDTEVIYFDRRTVFQKLDHEPSIAKFFLTLLAKKCLVLNQRIETLRLRSVRQRLIQYLLSHCPEDRSYLIDLTIKKADLAKLL
jgi:CRP/FNR family transcriptional regulator